MPIPHHLYADDSQLYVSFSLGDSASALGFCSVTEVDKETVTEPR